MSQEKNQVKEKKSSNKVWIVVLAVVLLGVNGIQGFFNYQQNDEIKQKDVLIVQKDLQRDSLITAIDAKKAELIAAKAEIEKLGGDVTALDTKIQDLENLNAQLKKDTKYKGMYFNIKKEIESANKLAADSKTEADRLKIQLAQQDTIINTQKAAISQKDQNISSLESEKTVLAQKVALASVLKAENIKVITVSSKGKEKIGEAFKAKSIEQIKIVFTVADNKVAQKNTKELFIRIVEPDGATITGGTDGEFKFGTQTLFYTTKTSILYNGLISPVTVSYTKSGAYKVGKQTIEVYCEGYLIGTGTFTVE